MKNSYRLVLILFALLYSEILYAQGIRGMVFDENGEGIPFATIFIPQTGSGTTTNFEGTYELRLAPGAYDLVFQHLGYASFSSQVDINSGYVDLDISLEVEAIVLRTVEVRSNNEDPAYTIMRKAIAKANFHRQQLTTYQARVYIKGSGRLLDAPFFLRKTLAKEGVDSTFTFVSESISEIKYTSPNTFDETVVSVRTSGEDNNSSPNGYIFGSFYEADIAGSVSPLSPKAFGYYKFEYMGTYTDREFQISKIKVTPRSKGDDVFTGFVSIVEDQWAIHSLDLATEKLGILVKIKQIYDPIQPRIWLPVSHRFEVTGKIFGFKFEYNYLATVSDYLVEINPDFDIDLEVIDEKVEKELANQIEQKNKTAAVAQHKLSSGEEVTRKELRKLVNAYEKQELENTGDAEVIENYNYRVDSLAANPDSTFWASIRPVPLSSREVSGYHKMDSIAVIEKQEAEGDTLETNKRKKKGFHIEDIILGNNYKVGERAYLRYFSPLTELNFNTVEGYNFNLRFRYRKTFENKNRLTVIPTFRYGFSSQNFYGKARANYAYGPQVSRGNVSIEGGKFVKQLNTQNPIHPLVNTFTTLLLQSNYMKLYQSGYVRIDNSGYFSNRLKYGIGIEWQERSHLDNTTNHTWIKQGKEYTSNDPSNAELSDTSFPYHRSLTGRLFLEYRPWLKFKIRNGRKRAVNGSSPTFAIRYEKGFLTSISETEFDRLELGFKHDFKIGVRGRLGVDVKAGLFMDTDNLYFPDFVHFSGNESPFLFNNPVGSYRLLSYYEYSTSDKYISVLMQYQFRKFLVTQIPILRLTGVKELAFIGYLGTPFSEQYLEVGYGIDNLFRFLRLEAAASFQDGQYQGFGIKIGVATSITGDGDAFSFGI